MGKKKVWPRVMTCLMPELGSQRQVGLSNSRPASVQGQPVLYKLCFKKKFINKVLEVSK